MIISLSTYSEFGKVFHSEGLAATNATRGVVRRSSPLLSPEEISRMMKRRTKYTNRRLLLADICTDKDISISQSRGGSTGIPLFSVQIINTCMSDCAPSDIHVNCGWFASSPPPNPNVFRRIAFNDCLVNNGKPLQQGNIIQFQYANSFMYRLTFKSAKFCRL
ncbi:hypothetical protein R1flu_021544 [Riccia fluitans]|uniref:Protein TAPETUM DETERMINANT 1 n=1 Tax=Riccia fluitans TaxID=41844 RepID=A0ABD1ZPP2_9MARC